MKPAKNGFPVSFTERKTWGLSCYLLLQEGIERYRHQVHAFCLMTKHVHLVVQVAGIPLST